MTMFRSDPPCQTPLVGNMRTAEDRRKVFRSKRQSTGSNNQAKECNLAFILICTTVTFFLLHLPRYLTIQVFQDYMVCSGEIPIIMPNICCNFSFPQLCPVFTVCVL